MKKLFVASVLALAVLMASQQRASAWHDFKFSAGVSLSWSGGGNSYFCGAFQGAPYPGDCVGFGGAYYGGFPYYNTYPTYPAYGAADAGWQAPAPSPAATAPAQQAYAPYYNTGYQPVGYNYSGSYPSQVPSYWYGR